MKTLFTLCIVAIACCTLHGQSTFSDLLKLFPQAALPYSPPQDFPDFDPNYPDDSQPKTFSNQKIPDELVKKFLDPNAEEGDTEIYPVHQINLIKYTGLVAYRYQYNRMDGTFMPFYYLYLINDEGHPLEVVMELSTSYFRASMSSLDVFESVRVNSEIYISEYDDSKIILKNTSTFSQSKSGEYGQRKKEENDFFYVLDSEGKWKNVTDRLED